MKTRVAILAIIVEDAAAVSQIQELLSQCSAYIIGRMGLPYPPKQVRIINVVLDAPVNTINALTGKIGRLPGVVAKAVFSSL